MFAIVSRFFCHSMLAVLMGLSSVQAAAPVASASRAAVATSAVVPVPAMVAPPPLTFREWKVAKIQSSQKRLQALQAQYLGQRTVNPRSPRLPLLQQELAQEHWNLEVAQDLTTRDYLYLYVKGQDVRPRLGEIAARLSSEEVGLFLESYFQLMERSQPTPVKRTRLGSQM